MRDFQKAQDDLGYDAGVERLATDGYLDPATARALAAYSGHWLPPCYGAWNARCGEAPGRAAAATSRAPAGHMVGGCWPASLGDPDSHATCDEFRASSSTDLAELRRRAARMGAACGDATAPVLIHAWVHDVRGCPKMARVAACAGRGEAGSQELEWFYEGSVDDVRARCSAGDRTLVLP